MNKTLYRIKTALDQLGQEYETAEGNKKQAIFIRICDKAADIGKPPLSDALYKTKDFETEMVEFYFCVTDKLLQPSFLQTFEQRDNKESGLGDYLFLAAKRMLIRKYNKEHPVINKQTENQKEKQRVNTVSIEQENPEGETFSVLDAAGFAEVSTDTLYELREQAALCIMDFLALMNHEGVFAGRKDNASNRDFVRLLYTEEFSRRCKTQSAQDMYIHNVFKSNETIAMKSVDHDFADHFSQSHCDSIEDFELVPYKRRSYFHIEQSPEKELTTPFDAKVYITFYEKFRSSSVSNALITRKRKEFNQLVDTVCGRFA